MNKHSLKQDDFLKVPYRASSLAIWLINEKGVGITRAVKIAANKHDCQKAPLERVVRSNFPEGHFESINTGYMTRQASEERKQRIIEGSGMSI